MRLQQCFCEIFHMGEKHETSMNFEGEILFETFLIKILFE